MAYQIQQDRLEGELLLKTIQTTMFTFAQQDQDFMEVLLIKYNHVQMLINIVGYILRWRNVKCLKQGRFLTAEERRKAKELWICYLQLPMMLDLQNYVCPRKTAEKKIKGPYHTLLPYLDTDGIWKVGTSARDYVPFMRGNRAAILLPRRNKFMELEMV